MTDDDIMQSMGFVSSTPDSLEKILKALMESDNIELKTEIPDPLNLAKLLTITEWFEANGYKRSADTLRKFITGYLKYMVSNKREGRKEIIHALAESLAAKRTVGEKLTEGIK